MKKPWIKESGKADEAELLRHISQYIAAGDAITLEGYTDHFESVRSVQGAEWIKPLTYLLELRIFRKDSELWAHRTMVGKDFSWRIADDVWLKQQVSAEKIPFFANSDNYRFENNQILDIDSKVSQGGHLRTTGGCWYSLPITDENRVTVVSYIGYQEDGTARVEDFRVKDFIREGGK